MKVSRPLAASLLLLLTGCATTGGPPPLPSDLNMIAPTASVPPQLAEFSGRWFGRMDSGVDHVLVVEELGESDAIIVFAHNGIPPAWLRVRAAFQNGALSFTSPPESKPEWTANYRLQSDGRLSARMEIGGRIVRGTLTRDSIGLSSQRPPASEEGLSLPSDIRIVPPSDSVPRHHARYSGRWEGRIEFGGLENQLVRHVLIVEEVGGDDAVIVLAMGKAGTQGPAWFRLRAQFRGGALKATDPSKAVMIYEMQPNGSLRAMLEASGIIGRGEMTRVR